MSCWLCLQLENKKLPAGFINLREAAILMLLWANAAADQGGDDIRDPAQVRAAPQLQVVNRRESGNTGADQEY